MITDETNKPLQASYVFARAIRYLKEHLFNSLLKQFLNIKEKDIQYVLTVPAIWDDVSKQFMREAAQEV